MKFNRSIVNLLQNDLAETLEAGPLIGSARDLEDDELEVEVKEEKEEVDIQTTEEEAMAGEQNLEAIRKKEEARIKMFEQDTCCFKIIPPVYQSILTKEFG